MRTIKTAEWQKTAAKKDNTDVTVKFLEMQCILKMFHWQTTSFAQHEAFGKTYDALLDSIDEFVEIMIGRHDRLEPSKKTITLKDVGGVKAYIDGCIDFLNGLSDTYRGESDLLNIRDEMLGDLNKLKYLLTLK